MNYEEEYLKKQELLARNILSTKEKMEDLFQEYEDLKDDESIDNKEKKLKSVKNQIIRMQNFLHLLEMEKKYSRVGTRETELEKSRIHDNFANELKKLLDPKYNYCFYGCRYIYLVKSIIESGIISSSVDRVGFEVVYGI